MPRQGVLHRDVKRENILIRDSDGRPVLVDFGIGYLAGEPTITGERYLPGTDEYRAPEFVRHAQDTSQGRAGYWPDVGDELWALGVTLYWLLTDVLPFGHRAEGGLYDRILTQTPPAPHERNPRVPPALSAVCMRMLEKGREARFSDYVELCGALDAALAAADGDARWDVPLMDPDAPDATPTVKVPGMGPPAGEAQAGLAWKADRPRRGRKAAQKPRPVRESDGTPAVPAPLPAKLAEPPAPAKVARAAASPAEALVAVLAEVAPQHAWEGLPPPVPESAPPGVPAAARAEPAPRRAPGLARPGPSRKARGPLRRALARVFPTSFGMLPVRAVAVASLRPAALFVVAVGALALASAGAWVVHTRPAPGSSSTARSVVSPSPPVESLRAGPAAQFCAVREVASSQERREAEVGAAFYLAPTPAPGFVTMLRKEDSPSRPEETPAPQLPRKGMRARFVEKCVGAACCAVLGACASTPPVRPMPRPEDCSSKALATMKELDIDIDDKAAGQFPVVGGSKPVPVNEFTTFKLLDDLGKLKGGTVLSGRLIFGQDRVSPVASPRPGKSDRGAGRRTRSAWSSSTEGNGAPRICATAGLIPLSSSPQRTSGRWSASNRAVPGFGWRRRPGTGIAEVW